MNIHTIKVMPTHMDQQIALKPDGFIVVEVPAFPYSAQGERLRAARRESGVILREAINRSGLGACEYSELERGGRILSSDTEWDALIAVVTGRVQP